jgi:mono/diheme cytochrome c family protein
MKKEKCRMSRALRLLLAFFALPFSLFIGAGCRQKMADQPYYRPYEPAEFFQDGDGRSNRPLERGVIHRGQYLEMDPRVTGLTREEWGRAHAMNVAPKVDLGDLAKPENRDIAIGAPRFDPRDAGKARVYVEEFPFAMTKEDIKRGQERYTIYCAVCHGTLGNGEGKIWERGYLKPTSFHTLPVGPGEQAELRNGVWYERLTSFAGKTGFPRAGVPLGYSRGYGIIWDIKIPMSDVPVGYYFEVITRGYAGMPSYSAQIPPDDRWRIVAYIRVLQLSQFADEKILPADLKNRLGAGGKQ